MLDLTPHICLVAGTGEGSSGSGDSCAVQGAEPSICGCCHSPSHCTFPHFPSPGLLRWGLESRILCADAPRCWHSRKSCLVWRVPPCMALFRQGFQPGLLSDLESSKATLQRQGGEAQSLQGWRARPQTSSVLTLKRCRANMSPISAGASCFSAVDVRCCVFTRSTVILKPE